MKYLIFDIDGTLTNTTAVDDSCFTQAFQLVFGEDIRDVDWSVFKNVTDWGLTEELVQLRLKRTLKESELKQMKDTFFQLLYTEKARNIAQFAEIPGASSLFNKSLKNPRFEVGIATGGWEHTARLKLDIIGINPGDISFSNSDIFKSREEITSDVINQMKFKYDRKPDEIIYFGDGKWDYLTCQKLNIRFIGVDYKRTGKLKEMGADFVLDDFMNVKLSNL